MGKFCGNCGAPLNPDARFCGSCGAAAEPARPPVAPARGGAAPRPKPARKSRKKGVIAVLSLIIVAALGAGFLFWFFGNSRMKPVTVERGPEPLAAQTASEAAAISLRQYIYARLATEAFAEADLEAMSVEEIRALAEDAARAWEDAALAASVAEEITAQAVEVLDASAIGQTAASGLPRAQFMTLTAPADVRAVALATSAPRPFDPKTWAENLTKQYDALKGAKRYQQLARQLGTDAKAAYEQMQLAQEIIHNEATDDAAFWDKLTKAAQAAKTISKVTMLGWSMAATGGGSVALLEGAGLLVGGVDCIVDVTETGSTIVLGDGNRVAVAFGDIKEKLGPVSALIGLVTLNPSGVGNAAKDTTEALVYITDSLTDLFYEDKVMGIKVEGLSGQAVSISGEVFEAGAKAAMEAAGFLFPQTTKTLLEMVKIYREAMDGEAMTSRLEVLSAQMTAIYQNPELYEDMDENGPEPIPEEELEEWESALEERENESAATDGGVSGGAASAASGWPGDFYGVSLPAPQTSGVITELISEVDGFGDEVTTIRIDGMTYEEFERYYETLTALPGWTPHYESNMPGDPYDADTDYEFDGIYGDLEHIAVFYFNQDTASSLGVPQFQMFVYKTF